MQFRHVITYSSTAKMSTVYDIVHGFGIPKTKGCKRHGFESLARAIILSPFRQLNDFVKNNAIAWPETHLNQYCDISSYCHCPERWYSQRALRFSDTTKLFGIQLRELFHFTHSCVRLPKLSQTCSLRFSFEKRYRFFFPYRHCLWINEKI